MKKYFIIILSLFSFVFTQDECRTFESEDECLAAGCEWGDEDGCYGNWEDSEDNEDYCEGLTEDECWEAEGCQWYDGEGCYRSDDNDEDESDDWEDNENYCEGLTEDECSEAEGCQWYDEEGCYRSDDGNNEHENHEDGLPECLFDCEGIEYMNPEESPYEACDWIISNFGPNNFMNSCAEDCDNETMVHINEYVETCFQCLSDNNCDDIFNDEDGEEDEEDFYCSDINNLYECYQMGCEWISGNMPGAGYCAESDSLDDDCDSELMCAPVITCYDGLLYPTSCGPENCDEPIGECDDNNEEGCFENGEWYCFGCEMFITDCDYYECTENGWIGPFTLNNNDCSDEEDWQCSELGYEDCMSYDFCEWIPNNNSPVGGGYCIDIENDDDGPPECVMDCEGVDSVDPEENLTYFCEWLLGVFPTGCAEDCEQEVLDEIEELMIVCDECLPNNNCDENSDFVCEDLNYSDCMQAEGCEWIIVNEWGGYGCVESDYFNCNDLDYEECLENPGCQPNYSATGQFENCEYSNEPSLGALYGRVEYIYGDAIDFVSYATLYIESLPSNSEIYSYEVMADGEGYYYIELPAGAYMVTAYANEETLTLDAQIVPNSEFELNFLLGDWDGPGQMANLSLGPNQTVPFASDVVMPLYLSSIDPVGGVQFTIELSDPGVLSLQELQSIDPCFTSDFNIVDGQIIGIIFSFEGCAYEPQDMLQIAEFYFTLSPYFQIGNSVDLYFNSTIVSDAIGNEIPSYGEGASVLVGMIGDVNADSEINVLDIVLMVGFALFVEDPNDNEFWCSDINADGMINVLDIVSLVNIILAD